MQRLLQHVGFLPNAEVVPRAELTSESGRAALLRLKNAQKALQKRGACALGLGTGVVAANQPGSVVRTEPIHTTVPTPTVQIPTVVPTPTVVHPPPIRRGVTHANRTVVGPNT